MSLIDLLIHSFNKDLLKTCYMSGTVLDMRIQSTNIYKPHLYESYNLKTSKGVHSGGWDPVAYVPKM